MNASVSRTFIPERVNLPSVVHEGRPKISQTAINLGVLSQLAGTAYGEFRATARAPLNARGTAQRTVNEERTHLPIWALARRA